MQKPFGEKKPFKIPLFWKFAIGQIIMVLLFGSINIALVHQVVYSSLEEELQQRGVSISRMISHRAIDLLLYDDFVALNRLAEEIKEAETSVRYIFVLNSENRVIAHTFQGGFPNELLNLYQKKAGEGVLTSNIKQKNSKEVIRDIAIPLFDGKVGTIRVGLSEENITQTLRYTITLMIVMIAGFLIVGMVGIFLFSFLVNRPVRSLSRITERINLKSIKEKRISFATRYPKAIERAMNYLPDDELDTLVTKFNEMVFRLEQAYDELEITQKQLVQSEKLAAIGTLASGIAHEVNNPLAGILHCIDRLKRKPTDIENNQKLLELMEDAANKVDIVVNGLLNFARQSDNKFEQIQFTEVISNSLMLASHKLEKARVTVNEIHKNANTLIKGNKNQLVQVVLNIILNCIDGISEKKETTTNYQGKITLRSEQEKDFLMLSIEDNGCGIPSSNISKVVDPFYTTKTVGQGTGLGLSISLSIMKEHGGDLIISSNENNGTTVLLSLPIA